MPQSRIEIVTGDITKLKVDAIVNAANEQLRPGGGVCGAIHRAAGPRLAEACAEIGGCPTGEARMTPAFELPASRVIHCVGPVWQGGHSGEPEALASCYRSAIALAAEERLRSIAFPAISTGVYGYPLEQATAVAVASVRAALANHPGIERVILVAFDERAETAYRRALEKVEAEE
jgi:O-acetyl-ADP-ribose deacetylase (regulator of RNase III)